MMTAVIQVSEQYTQQFEALLHSLPEGAIKLTPIKNSLDEELIKRVHAYEKGEVIISPIENLQRLRAKYAD